MNRGILLLALGLALSGCQVIEPGPPRQPPKVDSLPPPTERPPVPEREPVEQPPQGVKRQIAFPTEEYAALDKTGNSTIEGRIGAGGSDRVSIAPVTTYSAEAAEIALAGKAIEPPDPRAREYTHYATVNADGYFRVSGLPAGDYYVAGKVGNRVVINQVTVGAGQTAQVALER